MSVAAIRWALWLAALCVVPVPYWAVEAGLVPVLRLAVLGAMCLAVVVGEGDTSLVALLSGLFLVEAALWATLLWLALGVLARRLGRLGPTVRTSIAASLIAVLVGIASAVPIYRTPFSGRAPTTTLFEILD